MPNLRSEGYKTLSKGERSLPRVNSNEPLMAAVDTILKFTLPIAMAAMTIRGVADTIKSFKTNYGGNSGRR